MGEGLEFVAAPDVGGVELESGDGAGAVDDLRTGGSRALPRFKDGDGLLVGIDEPGNLSTIGHPTEHFGLHGLATIRAGDEFDDESGAETGKML